MLARAFRRLRDVPGMPATTPMPTKVAGDVLTSALWNTYVRDNIDKLLTRGHRVLTVAQFTALASVEGTKGSVPPDEVYVEVDATNGILWHVAYESGEPTNKWRFLGGSPLTADGTGGPASVTVPRSGDFYYVAGGRAAVASGGDASVTLPNGDPAAFGNFAVHAGVSVLARASGGTITTSRGGTTSPSGRVSVAVTPTRMRHDA